MDKNEIVCSGCANAAETQVRGRVWCKEWQRYVPEDGYCFRGDASPNCGAKMDLEVKHA